MNIVSTGLSAKTVANYFLDLASRDGVPIDPLKLQKLIYLAHGWSLVLLKKPLIKEPFEAWNYGPVVPSLYKAFQKFGASPITEHAPKEPFESHYELDAQTKSLLDSVWETYKKLNSIQLSMFTHEPGYAWDLARRGGRMSPWGSPAIPNELIANEFIRRQQQAE
ncbi:MAG TPA: type II toxin-antitoxin system antitoxin SocA domain-containing protein [Candidatus Acidoferrum sp.]|nr:type II toxin-antitoxin system antitoxin SocA domain-containing protein [Candidatus Acidoferrum sp.]